MKKKYVLALLLISTISITTRCLFFHYFLGQNHNYMVPEDSAQYDAKAQSLLTGKIITTHTWAGPFHRLPGYPLYLASCYAIFGTNQHRALWIQVIIASCIPLLIFWLALLITTYHLPTAIIAGLASSLHVGFITYAGSMMAESLFMIFFLLFIICFFYHPIRNHQFLLAGILLGISSIIRPVGIPLMLLSIIYLLILKRLQACLSLSFGWLSIAVWVIIHNYLACGALFFHTLPGIHFLRYSTASVYKEIHGCSFYQAREALDNAWHKRIKQQHQPVSEPLKCTLAEQITWQYSLSHPFLSLKHFIINIIKTCFGLHAAYLQFVDTKELFEHKTAWGAWERIKIYFPPQVTSWFLIPITYAELASSLLMLIGLIGACIQAFYLHYTRYLIWLTLPWAILLIALTFGAGCARLRLPADIFFILISSYWWVSLVNPKQPLSLIFNK